jgi:hypothetical protein
MVAIARHRRNCREADPFHGVSLIDTIRRRILFGPLLYGTLLLAGSILVGLGLWSLWPAWRQSREMRAYAAGLSRPVPSRPNRNERIVWSMTQAFQPTP